MRRIGALYAGRRHAEGLAAAAALLRQVPENRDVLYLVAVGERGVGHAVQALATLERLQSLHPGFSRLYQELGQCRLTLQDLPRAIEALEQAVRLNPALPVSWRLLEGLYRRVGRTRDADAAAAQSAALECLPRAVRQAGSLLHDGDAVAAEGLVRDFLASEGPQVEAMHLLARIAMAREAHHEAQPLLAAVLEISPDRLAARYDHARVLVECHRYALARRELDGLLTLDPGNRPCRILYATVCMGLGEHARAVDCYRRLLAEAPQDAQLRLLLGHALKTDGRAAEAIEAYRAATTALPAYGEAYWSLANLKTYRFTDEELQRMQAAEAAPETASVDRQHLCFALGKACEDRAEYARSWRYYERGNALKHAASGYRPEIIEADIRPQMRIFTREFLGARAGCGAEDPAPIFIVGLPRSGSTLLEQILASHSQVEGTQELPDIPRIVLEFQGRDPDPDHPRYPEVLQTLPPQEWRRLGERYLNETRIQRRGRPFFIDKMPNNFRHLGLIHLMLPNARIIDARREPLACCFGNLKQLFAQGQEFSYRIADIARYYRGYLELMAHWNGVLPGRILRVHHEDVVEDLEGSVRRLLQFCGLPFEPACVAFHATARGISTASSEQVRQPIFRHGLDQWRHYEPWLGELRTALGDATRRYRD